MSIDPNDLLLSGSMPYVSFKTIGDTAKGRVVASRTSQQRDYAHGKPQTGAHGDPMMQVASDLQTDQQDPQIPNDDGVRRVYVRGQMMAAVREALRAANAKLEVGGELAIQYVSDKPSETKGFHPAKQFQAQYRPSTAGQVNDLLGAPTAAPPPGGVAPESIL